MQEEKQELVEEGFPKKQETEPVPHWTSRLPKGKWTIALVVLQVVVYVVTCVVEEPSLTPERIALLKVGLVQKQYISCAACGYVLELRRLIVPIFLHLSVFHLASNVVFQLLVGTQIETALGSKKFLIVFFAAGVVGNLLAAATGETSAGASTACYGLLGVGLTTTWLQWPTMAPATQLETKNRLTRELVWLLVWEIAGWYYLAHFGHLGGLIAGICVTLLISETDCPRSARMQRFAKLALFAVSTACTLILFVPAMKNFTAAKSKCDSLMYIYQ
jgi:rhomboid protease GluP